MGFFEGALAGGFADAENGGDFVADAGGDFLADVFVGVVEEVAALGMTDEAVIDQAVELADGGFAGEGAEVAEVGVLGGEAEFVAVDLERQRLQRNGGRRDDDFEAALVVDFLEKFVQEDGGFADGKVHLPVAHDVRFHEFIITQVCDLGKL